MSVYDKRIADLRSRGMTTEQAKANQAHAVKVGADANGDGAVTNSEWAQHTGRGRSSGSGSFSSGARTGRRSSSKGSGRSTGGTKGGGSGGSSGSGGSGGSYGSSGSSAALAKSKVQAYKNNQSRGGVEEGTLGQFKFQAPASKKWTI